MKIKIIITILPILLIQTTFAQITVSGISDPWLAGMPNGSTASDGDSAPIESPALVTGPSVTGGATFSFSASGFVTVDPSLPFFGPDGWAAEVFPHSTGAENGIADITAPLDALVGIFLGPTEPDLQPVPSALDFSTSASQNYLTLSPDLQQPFFIGDGLTDSEVIQQVIAPAGATRLFLGTMDGSGWFNNPGAFSVEVIAVPEPNIFGIAAIGLVAWRFYIKSNRSREYTA